MKYEENTDQVLLGDKIILKLIISNVNFNVSYLT